MKIKSGFVLLETAVVLIVVVVAMLGLYSTYSFVFKSLKQSQKYDDINDTYKLNVFLKLMEDKGFPDSQVGSAGWIKITSSNCDDSNNYFDDAKCSNLMTNLGFDYFIYIGKSTDTVLLNKTNNSNVTLSNSDINYIKDLDHNYKYLIGVHGTGNDMYYVSMKAGKIN